MGPSNSCSKTEWELEIVFSSLLSSAHGFQGSFIKVICSFPASLEQLLNTTARWFRDIYENYKAFCNG
jgi:hypothetical protein